ncbi:MAG TPA: phospho-N-acetylmuramoyl-pentapeptide-transferase [Candidatus Baltobacteraceae bacterium]|nr:phospho-N-acetylmuramoyl-pentapeptide-transferase [Candidatus Baltobacteraceae bacterium]
MSPHVVLVPTLDARTLLMTAPLWAFQAAVVVLVAGALVLPLLRRFQFRQRAYEDAPETHQVKSGTPTMGGVVFIVAMAIAMLNRAPLMAPLGFLVILCGLVGFADDYLAIRQGTNRGLRARTKFLLTALIAIVFLRALDGSYSFFPRDTLFHAGTYSLIVPHWLWLVLGICAVTGTIHAVNLTDGLDGLATGSIVPPLAVYVLLGAQTIVPSAMIGAATGVGACLGFLFYNRHPAKMFMGDTGSLALGALLAGVAILSGEMLLLIVVGGVFVAETLSVILQVTYFKLTQGERIFRMSPLHHHYELAGWPETKVTARFWLASFLCSVVGWAIVR